MYEFHVKKPAYAMLLASSRALSCIRIISQHWPIKKTIQLYEGGLQNSAIQIDH